MSLLDELYHRALLTNTEVILSLFEPDDEWPDDIVPPNFCDGV